MTTPSRHYVSAILYGGGIPRSGDIEIELPAGAKIIEIDNVDFALRIWVIRDMDQKKNEVRRIMIRESHGAIEVPMDSIKLIGSFAANSDNGRYFAFEYLTSA